MKTPSTRPVYSVTALVTYERCPHQYWMQYVLRIPPPRTPAMVAGTSIHKLISDHLTAASLLPPEAEPHVLAMFEDFKRSRFNVPPVLSEESFVHPFEGGDVRGRIDVVLPAVGGGLEVVDFKSGSTRPRDELEANLQLPLYTLAVAQKFEFESERLAYTYYFLRDGVEEHFTPTAGTMEETRRRVEEVMAAIARGEFQPRSGCRCWACRRPGRRAPVPA